MTSDRDVAHEAQRQRWLLHMLRGDSTPPLSPVWLRGSPWQQMQGLQAYRANAAASAERAMADAYPTVQQLLGCEAFAALAQAHWHEQPPMRGDLALWGEALPDFIAGADQLAAEPYLADVARLDWALHQARRVRDDDVSAVGLHLLGSADPAALCLQLRAAHVVLISPHPLHTLWAAHQSDGPHRFDAARQALAQARGEAVRVERQGLHAVATGITLATAGFEHDLLQGRPLAAALNAADPAFALEPWLIDTLRRGALATVLLQVPR